MTKKHFKLIADTISKIENLDERRAMAEFNAKTCAKANPRFDKQKFFAACGLPNK